MGQRTETRQRIIEGAMTTFRRQGFSNASISDIVATSGAPRGSVTFHFPGGKDEIASEVIALRTDQILDGLDQLAASTATARDLLVGAIDQVADDLGRTDYALGCPVLPVAIERSVPADALRDVSRDFFTAWRSRLAALLHERGVEAARADRVATLTVSALEGAIAIGRLERSTHALDEVRAELPLLLPAA